MKKRNKNEISESVLASSISRWLESSNGAMLGQPPTADQSSDVPFGRRPSCGGAGARPGQPGRPHAPHHPRAARPQPRAARGGVAADPPQAAAPEQPPPGHVPRPRQTPVTGTSSAVGHSAPAAVYCKCITASSIVAHHRVPPVGHHFLTAPSSSSPTSFVHSNHCRKLEANSLHAPHSLY